MMERLDLSVVKPSVEMSTPSTEIGLQERNQLREPARGTGFPHSLSILPSEISTSLNKANIEELFPLPVLPTMPIFSPALTSRLRFFRTFGRPGRYAIVTLSDESSADQFQRARRSGFQAHFWNEILPSAGQDSAGAVAGTR